MGDLQNIDLSELAGMMMGNRMKKNNDIVNNGSYVGAPYNFVSFANKTYQYPQGKQRHHNEVCEELFTGELTYEITAHTPIIVDGGDGHFFKTTCGEYAIPGSTIRGLIRNNVQILGLSSMEDDIDDYALMYRSIASGSKEENRRYSKVLGTNNSGTETKGLAVHVKAGYVTLENGAYYIDMVKELFDKGANYLMLSSRHILYDKDNFPFFTCNWKEHMMYTSDCVFERKEMINGKYNNQDVSFSYKAKNSKEVEMCIENGEFSFEGSEICKKRNKNIVTIYSLGMPGTYSKKGKVKYQENKGSSGIVKRTISRTISYDPIDKDTMINAYYEPYYEPVYFELDETNKKIKSVYPKDYDANSLPHAIREGYVLSSGWINGKKNLYIIPEIQSGEHTFEIQPKDLKAFSVDLNKRIKTLKRYFDHGQTDPKELEQKARAYFGLPKKEGERKPIFFMDFEGRLYFGFTPRLRLFYDYTIKKGLAKNLKEQDIDYCKAIFGHSQEKDSYKSKVSFLDAVISKQRQKQTGSELSETKLALAEPKPTSYWDYLKQNGDYSSEPVTYNNPDMQLRGIKQYWLHEKIVLPEKPAKKESDNESKTKESESTFYPLPADTAFIGKIRFWNMTKDELGLLLWSIRLEPGKSHMNIGKAKPYGYGCISLELNSAKRFDMQTAYSLEGLNLNPFKDIDVEDAIRAYKDHINQFLNGKEIDDLIGIKEFFAMKDSTNLPDSNKIKYMNIDNGDYQNRRKPLQSVDEIIEK